MIQSHARRRLAVTLVGSAIGMGLIAGCSPERNLTANGESSGGLWSLMPSSPAFTEGHAIPKRYTADGENLSPPLTWTGGPTGTRSYVLIVEDDTDEKHPPVSWLVYNIPGTARGLAEGAASDDRLTQGKNRYGSVGYSGPSPQSRGHHFYFELFALNGLLQLPPGADRAAVVEAMAGKELAKGQLVATYRK